MFQRATLTAGLVLISGLLLNGCGSDADDVKERQMIIIGEHYPENVPCGTGLDLILNGTVFSNTASYVDEENETCATLGRDENSTDPDKLCYVQDFQSDTNETCIIGVDYFQHAGDAVELVKTLTDKIKNRSKN